MADIDEYDIVLKVCLIGDSSVGKSNIQSVYINNIFNDYIHPTIGLEVSYKYIHYNDLKIKLIVWDTAGQEKYKSVTNTLYNNAKGCLIVFDLTNEESLKSVSNWLEDYKENSGNDNIVIIGNKSDLPGRIDNSKIKDYINNIYNYEYFIETSALNGTNIENAFDILIDLIYNNYIKLLIPDENNNNNNKIILNENICLNSTNDNNNKKLKHLCC